MHVETIVKQHWETYGRNFYVRYDYEGVEKSKATAVMSSLVDSFATLPGRTFLEGKYEVRTRICTLICEQPSVFIKYLIFFVMLC